MKSIDKKYKLIIVLIFIAVVFVIKMVAGSKTVASGNGYSHKIGSFGKCDMHFDDCTNDATHRRHHFFGNEDYCEACWNQYGLDMFERLSNTKSSPSTVLEYDEFKCRHAGCDKKASSSEWKYRFCTEHAQGTTNCRYPGCDREIPINGIHGYSRFCSEHD